MLRGMKGNWNRLDLISDLTLLIWLWAIDCMIWRGIAREYLFSSLIGVLFGYNQKVDMKMNKLQNDLMLPVLMYI